MRQKAIIHNVSWLFIDKIVRIVGGILIGVWIARYLGPTNYGILNYSIAFVAFFSFLSKLGLDQIVVRELARNNSSRDKILSSAFTLKLLGSILALVFAIISILFIKSDSTTHIIVALITLGYIFQSYDVIDYFFQSKMLSKLVVIARTSGFILSSLLNIYFILNKSDVIYFGFTILINIILSSFFLILIYLNYGNKLKFSSFNIKYAKTLLSYSWPLMISTFFITIYSRIDQVMIDMFLNSKEVGIYSVAVKLSNYWLFIPGILVNTLMPYFVKLREENMSKYKLKMVQLFSVMFWMGLLVGLIILFWGKPLIVLLYGAEYATSHQALVYNIWSGIFISQAMARGIWLISENLQKYRLFNNIFAVSLNIIGNIILIPKFGIVGAAVATLITQGLGTWVFGFVWKPLRSSNLDIIKSVNPKYIISFINERISSNWN